MPGVKTLGSLTLIHRFMNASNLGSPSKVPDAYVLEVEGSAPGVIEVVLEKQHARILAMYIYRRR